MVMAHRTPIIAGIEMFCDQPWPAMEPVETTIFVIEIQPAVPKAEAGLGRKSLGLFFHAAILQQDLGHSLSGPIATLQP